MCLKNSTTLYNQAVLRNGVNSFDLLRLSICGGIATVSTPAWPIRDDDGGDDGVSSCPIHLLVC